MHGRCCQLAVEPLITLRGSISPLKIRIDAFEPLIKEAIADDKRPNQRGSAQA